MASTNLVVSVTKQSNFFFPTEGNYDDECVFHYDEMVTNAAQKSYYSNDKPCKMTMRRYWREQLMMKRMGTWKRRNNGQNRLIIKWRRRWGRAAPVVWLWWTWFRYESWWEWIQRPAWVKLWWWKRMLNKSTNDKNRQDFHWCERRRQGDKWTNEAQSGRQIRTGGINAVKIGISHRQW